MGTGQLSLLIGSSLGSSQGIMPEAARKTQKRKAETQGAHPPEMTPFLFLLASSQGQLDLHFFFPCFYGHASGEDGCIIIIIILVNLRMSPEGCGTAIYNFWDPVPYRIFVSPVSSLAVLFFVLNQLFIYRYMEPEGLWQRPCRCPSRGNGGLF